MFYGVIIYMYFFDDERHKLPHIHAKYQGKDASFSILDGTLLPARFPRPKPGWSKPGSKSTGKNFWPTGNSLSKENRLSVLTHYGRSLWKPSFESSPARTFTWN